MADKAFLNVSRGKLFWSVIFGRRVGIFCDHCGKYISASMDWACGYCDKEYLAVWVSSFLTVCDVCGKKPQSVLCPHCHQPTTLTPAGDTNHPARPLNANSSRVPAATMERLAKRHEHEARAEELTFKIMEAQLAAELKQCEQPLGPSAAKSPEEELVEKLARDKARFLGVDQIVERQIALLESEFAHNPTMIAKGKEFLERWREEHSI